MPSSSLPGEVSASVTNIRGKELYFYVTDTGCGIPKDKQESIFGRFVKLNSFAQGTGLGLSICRTLVEHMGGHIGVDSEEGKGSTFWFSLPYKAASTSAGTMQKTEIQPISVEKDKLTILIAEDNESNYRLFESILGHDYHLIHAWDGREAVERFKRENPQIILMDINMPVMDGYEATQEIRKYSAKVPIIAVTAFALRFGRATGDGKRIRRIYAQTDQCTAIKSTNHGDYAKTDHFVMTTTRYTAPL